MIRHGKDCVCGPGNKRIQFYPTTCDACPTGEYMDVYANYDRCKLISDLNATAPGVASIDSQGHIC